MNAQLIQALFEISTLWGIVFGLVAALIHEMNKEV